jgi:thioredoxin-dependent peroxiredoxin
MPTFETSKITVLGASPDSIKTLSNWREKENLPYNLLSDPDHKVAEQYGVWGEKKMYGKTYEGVIRSHFVINAGGQLEDVQYSVSPQQSIDEALRYIASS